MPHTLLGYLWCFSRVFIRAASGHKRFNVLGALDPFTFDIFTVTNDSYINSQSVALLLQDLRERFPDIPITLVMDNARYQRCRLVMDLAQELRIELLFLPPYSPNLNLIERFWKFVKSNAFMLPIMSLLNSLYSPLLIASMVPKLNINRS